MDLVFEDDYEEEIEEFVEKVQKLGEKEETIESGRILWDGDAPGYSGLKYEGNKEQGKLSFWTNSAGLVDSYLDVYDVSMIKESIENLLE